MLSAGQMYGAGYGDMNGDANRTHNMMTAHHDHGPAHRAPLSGLDALAQGSQYMQQLHAQQGQGARFGSYGGGGDSSSGDGQASGAHDQSQQEQRAGQANGSAKTSGAVRRRISRACDQCNQLRTKCDGKTPCAHCVEFGLSCEYNRERKKRGKASRKDMAAQHASMTGSNDTQESPQTGAERSPASTQDVAVDRRPSLKRHRSHDDDGAARPALPPPRPIAASSTVLPPISHNAQAEAASGVATRDFEHRLSMQMHSQNHINSLPNPQVPGAGLSNRNQSISLADFPASMDDYHRNILHTAAASGMSNSMTHTAAAMMTYGDSPYPNLASPQSQSGLNTFRLPASPMSNGQHNFLGGQTPNAGGSPGWLLPSPSAALYSHMPQTSNQTLRYPVLKPILSRISAIIPISLACDLLEIYFKSSYSTLVQPASPYVLGVIFRKRSFLRQNNPRPCSPALLASMLWVGAQTCESPFLTSPPSARGKVCQQLLELTVSLLRPLIHTPAEGVTTQGMNPVINGVALGGFGVALHTARHDNEGGSTGATGAIDDVATYMNLATVVSASEYKAASLRWWNAAWSLARELKLGRELPPNPEPTLQTDAEAVNESDGMSGHPGLERRPSGLQTLVAPPGTVSEEEREIRRRLWWLLYIIDRHLALCYNRPLFLLDAECDGLLQPEDENVYQAGEYYPSDPQPEPYFRRRGPGFECTGHSIYGYFLPLMTILGEIVDLNHSRNHPRFGPHFRNSQDLQDVTREISLQLDAYGRSLEVFKARFIPASKPEANGNTDDRGSPSNKSTSTSGARITEVALLTHQVVAYSSHLMNTMHILLNGKWDPISLLDDNDLWISSQSFITATGHAVAAAEAINDILDYDPDLSFMPFFFGIYLLQGSFLLLLIADKLQGEASPSVVKACEAIVRAHEVCVVTLNTEYQRNFRKVMRSALQQVRGRTIEDFGEQQQRRREVLALYRWTGDGQGLAL